MGQKVSPMGLRVGINREWDAAWYAEKTQVANLLLEDLKIRKYLNEVYAKAAISRVIIERVKGPQNKDRVNTLFYHSTSNANTRQRTSPQVSSGISRTAEYVPSAA